MMPAIRVLKPLGAAALVLMIGAVASAQAQTSAPASAPKPKAPQKLSSPPKAEPEAPPAAAQQQPRFVVVDHAQKAGIKTCLPMMQNATAALVDSEQSGVSIWNKDAPEKHAFVGTSFGAYPNQVAPRALSIISAVPTSSSKCDASSVRIQPSALSCDQIATNLKGQNGPNPDMAGDTRIYPINGAGVRTMLMRAASGDGCVVITQQVIFGQ